jgi:Thaumarchaeal output domain 1
MNDIVPPVTGHAVPAPADLPSAAQERRLDLLRQISAAGGTITPSANPNAEHGYAYALIGDDVEQDLAFLSARNYVEPRFFDRVSLCPKCDSHHLNVREICPGCKRAHLSAEGLLHHFACGYVGIPSEFSPTEDGSYLCPKCNRRMHHLGTEFDRLGKAFSCRGCGLISENPPAEAVCLACGARNRAEDLISVLIFSYVLTSRGAAALRRGSLFDGDEEDITVVDTPVYRRKVTLEFLDNELRRLQRFKDTFSLLLIKCAPEALGPSGNQAPTEWLSRLRENLRDVDLIGQVGDALYIVILPQTKRREAESLCDHVEAALGRESPLTLSIAEITEPRDLAQALPGLTARTEP